MTDVTPQQISPALLQALTQPASNVQAVQAVIDQLPARLAALTRALTIQGTLAINFSQQTALLHTAQGDVSLNFLALQKELPILKSLVLPSQPSLKLNADLQLEPQTNAPLPKAILFAEISKTMPLTRISQSTEQLQLLIGKSVVATPLQTLTLGTTSNAPTTSLETFTQQTKQLINSVVQLLSAAQPNPPSAPQAQPILSTTTAPKQNNLPEFRLHIVQIHTAQPPGETAPAAALKTPLPLANQSNDPIAASHQLLLTVSKQTAQSNSVVLIGQPPVAYSLPIKLPIGTQILLQAAEPATQLALEKMTAFSDTHADWPGLKTALETLAASNPALAQKIARLVTPHLGPQFTGALAFVLSALKLQDVRTLLGETAAAAIERLGKLALLKDISVDMQRATLATADAVIGEWRSYHLPLPQDQPGLTSLSLYIHRDPQQQQQSSQSADSSKDKKQHTRFLLDVHFTRLGDMQFDGFVKPKQLDLILRSDQKLLPPLQTDLKELFNRSLHGLDYAGSLTFQNGRQSWITMLGASRGTNYSA